MSRAVRPSRSSRMPAPLSFLALAGAFVIFACTLPAPIEGAACNVEHPCPGGYGCAGGSCRRLVGGPITRCTSDEQCPVGRCLIGAGFCVQCVENSDCVASTCLPELYQCGCRTDAQCATGRCNEATATCLSCFADEQCASADCDLDHGVCRKIDDLPVGAEESHGRQP
ncbi:MAG: hypothetical protein U1F43_19195 [Myxococcota bacterium]